jgi:hypothetical protein
MTRKIAAFAVGIPLAVLLVVWLPTLALGDERAPASVAPFVDSARSSLRSEAIEGPFFWWPLHLRFVEARCSVEYPGRVALVFEAWRPPYLSKSWAFAVRGSMPTSADDGWGGGFGSQPADEGDEFQYQIGAGSVPCP